MKNNLLLAIFFITFIVLSYSCDKPAGTGGTSSIKGKIYMRDYNSTFTILQSSHYAMEERVYIIYGDHTFYDNDIKTSYDGAFEFDYLRKGMYQIFTYTKDSTLNGTLYPGGIYAIIDTVHITEDNQVIELPTTIILQ